ncbi:MFS transporter [Streptomyces sp. H27-D2]|uniref:MFS transporter n=1 Tax=Streptomyces sp. H27-D2 TaxID=3046304 RepID=UPI002DBDAB39|nr:MFS transporter [Streptomyces sp. H27-D2]MEC4020623.1 MFS transporter [Streptomyces sp. H27-D2]
MQSQPVLAGSVPVPALDPRRWAVLAVLSGSLLIIAMDTTILNVAFPSLVADLRPGSVEQLWIIDSYALALSGLLITAGALGDRFGRKLLLITGFSIFALASLAAVLATAPWQLIAARALLGVGGAAIMPSTLSILRQVFSDARERAVAYAVWAAVFGGGMALGPVVGGLLVQSYGWHAAFLLNLPIAVLVIGLGLWLLPESRKPALGGWDWWGVGQSMTGMFALAAGIKQLGESGPASATAWSLLAASAVLLTVFVRRQLRREHPLLQVRLFANRSFSASAASLFLAMAGMGAVLFLLSQWFQYVQGYGPLEAGTRLLPAPVALIVTSLLVPTLMSRFPVRNLLGVGMLMMAAGLALPWAVQQFAVIGYPAFAVSLGILGCGVGTATTVASVTLMAATPPEEAGGAAAIEETSYELGAALGVAVLGSLAGALYRADLAGLRLGGADLHAVRESIGEAALVSGRLGGAEGAALLGKAAGAFTSGMTPAFLGGAVLALIAAVACWIMIPRDLRPTENSEH